MVDVSRGWWAMGGGQCGWSYKHLTSPPHSVEVRRRICKSQVPTPPRQRRRRRLRLARTGPSGKGKHRVGRVDRFVRHLPRLASLCLTSPPRASPQLTGLSEPLFRRRPARRGSLFHFLCYITAVSTRPGRPSQVSAARCSFYNRVHDTCCGTSPTGP